MTQIGFSNYVALAAVRGSGLTLYQSPVPLRGIFETATGAYKS